MSRGIQLGNRWLEDAAFFCGDEMGCLIDRCLGHLSVREQPVADEVEMAKHICYLMELGYLVAREDIRQERKRAKKRSLGEGKLPRARTKMIRLIAYSLQIQ